MSQRREQLVTARPNTIVFESYLCSGSDARVHIDVQNEARLAELESITQKLSTGEIKTFHLSELDDAYWLPPLADIVLSVSENGSDVRNHHRAERMVCEWNESAEGFRESTEKIAVLRASSTPCHQYFEGPHADSVTIELAYKE